MDSSSHPPQCPDAALHHFQLFGALKDAIHRKIFGSYEEVTEEVAVQNSNWYKKGTDALVSH